LSGRGCPPSIRFPAKDLFWLGFQFFWERFGRLKAAGWE
jgi:hypothetical protein